MNQKRLKYRRGPEFALVGAGKSGPHKKDRKGNNHKKDRKQSKASLREYCS